MQNNMVIDGHRVSTWFTECAEPPYQAVAMSVAAEKLKGYELSESEKSEIPELMMGYCRLIEEMGLTGYGETEFEAIQDLFGKAVKK